MKQRARAVVSWVVRAALAVAAVPLVAAGEGLPDAGAASPAPTSAEDAAEHELLDLLAEQTDLATKTRMNSDYVPGIVTVLHGDELEALGVHTVWEALAPGVQVVRDERGSPSLTVRGIDFIFNTGNTKVLLNDVSMSRESAGVNNSILLLPVEQVDRIEVIRGPGSAIHGDFAFQGLINVITRNDGDRVLVRGQDPSSWTGVIAQGWTSKRRAVRTNVSLSGLWSDDADAPRPHEADEARRAALASVEGKFGWFRGQFVTRTFELEPAPGAPSDLDEENWALAWGGRFPIGRGWSIDADATRSGTDHDTRPRLLFRGDVTDLGVAFLHEGRRHDTLIGAACWSGGINHAAVQPPPPAGVIDVFDQTRTIRSVTFQEVVRPTDEISVTVGARWDDFNDTDSELSPRLALVWQFTKRNVLKAQYAEAFRAPTFFEQAAPSPDPGSEHVATTELGWIHRRPNTILRATAFHSELEDGLGPGPGGPSNLRSATVNGLEVEWTQSFAEKVKLITNVSYADPAGESFVFGWSRWLGNVALVATPTEHLTIGTRWYHVGTRGTPFGDEFDGYDWVDLTLSFKDVGADGVDFRVGVKNLLDDDFVHPIPSPRGPITPTYDDRVYWASFAYRW